jgi:hypothetical protein
VVVIASALDVRRVVEVCRGLSRAVMMVRLLLFTLLLTIVVLVPHSLLILLLPLGLLLMLLKMVVVVVVVIGVRGRLPLGRIRHPVRGGHEWKHTSHTPISHEWSEVMSRALPFRSDVQLYLVRPAGLFPSRQASTLLPPSSSSP